MRPAWTFCFFMLTQSTDAKNQLPPEIQIDPWFYNVHLTVNQSVLAVRHTTRAQYANRWGGAGEQKAIKNDGFFTIEALLVHIGETFCGLRGVFYPA